MTDAPTQITDEQKAEMTAAFMRMTAQARRDLKKLSKNELVRTVIAQLIEKHQLQQALAEASQALEASTPLAASTSEDKSNA